MAKQQLVVVERDPKARRVLKLGLQQAGYRVSTASDGAAALDKIRRLLPVLVVASTDLPGVDGYGLVRRLRDDEALADIPVIFMVTAHSIEDKIRGLELGVEEYLDKPVFLKELQARVNMILAKRVRRDLSDAAVTTQVRGSLADIAPIDLFESLEAGQQSGVLMLSSGDKQGKVWFRSGEAVDAELGDLRGEEAFFRMLGWTVGDFEIDQAGSSHERTIEGGTRALIDAGVKHVAEVNSVLAALPERGQRLKVELSVLEERMGGVPEGLLPLLELLDGSRDVFAVLDVSPFDDLSTLETIGQLQAEELLEISGPKRASAPGRQDADRHDDAPAGKERARPGPEADAKELSAAEPPSSGGALLPPPPHEPMAVPGKSALEALATADTTPDELASEAPWSDVPRHEPPRDDPGQDSVPYSDAPWSDKPERQHPGGAADSDAPDSDAPTSDGPDSDGPDSDGPDSDGPDSDGPDSDGPDSDELSWGAPDAAVSDSGALDSGAPDSGADEPYSDRSPSAAPYSDESYSDSSLGPFEERGTAGDDASNALSESGVSASFFASAPDDADTPDPESEDDWSDSEPEPTFLSDEQRARQERSRKLVMMLVGGLTLAVLAAVIRAAVSGDETAPAPSTSATVVTTGSGMTGPSASGAPSGPSAAPSVTASASAGASAAPSASASAAPDSDLPDVENPLKEAEKLLNIGRYKEAIPMARAAIAKNPDNGDGYFFLATALQSIGKMPDAKKVYADCVATANKGRYLNYCKMYAPK